jgi:hypothetical protein
MQTTGVGYIFKSKEHGSFSPYGKMADMTDEQVEAHNRAISDEVYALLKETGVGVRYLFRSGNDFYAGTWDSKPPHRFWCFDVRHSRNNFGAQRTDVSFNYAGSRWHGVNIGANDILRVKRCKH